MRHIGNTSNLPKKIKKQWPFFEFKPINLSSKYERWRRVAKILKISKAGQQRLKWIIYYFEESNKNISQTARHFGISRKTFHKWFNVFDEDNLYTLHLLENRSKTPNHVRQKEVTQLETSRIIKIRKQHMEWGKMKLQKVYKKEFNENISSWKIQYVIKLYKLFPNPEKVSKLAKKRNKTRARKRNIKESKRNMILILKI